MCKYKIYLFNNFKACLSCFCCQSLQNHNMFALNSTYCATDSHMLSILGVFSKTTHGLTTKR